MKPILLIMAAGLGSRYGGLKQIDKIGPNGEILLELAVHDAIKAGFEKIVFILRREIEEEFKELIGNKLEEYVEIKYVIQEIGNLPEGYTVPNERTKPWGTGQAILCARDIIDAPFVAINADDFYGQEAFRKIYEFLINNKEENMYGMVGYKLCNTLSENGHVARGVCKVKDGYLEEVIERTKIIKKDEAAFYTEDEENWIELDYNSTVSMNMWAFNINIFEELEIGFKRFLDTEVKLNPKKSEYFIPSVVSELLSNGKISVKVMESKDKWYGVTYKEDKDIVRSAIENMIKQGVYHKNLWGEIKRKCVTKV
ncbi:sugar phosphate nucleotidyltransferase [Clostridium sp. 1001271B_151109_B4]|uniref:nucleotidyltransferase family protein n=1 Tax=Clostridium sp. 1001271B_151109_B4 TaxID=2787148 RepID=UPI0018AAFC3C|nr:sugar phosphate nucleotidyltransferase [Clostridium sp. 1001271B_151109_B4]